MNDYQHKMIIECLKLYINEKYTKKVEFPCEAEGGIHFALVSIERKEPCPKLQNIEGFMDESYFRINVNYNYDFTESSVLKTISEDLKSRINI